MSGSAAGSYPFQGSWGPYPTPQTRPPFWGLINADASIQASSQNFTVTTGSTGIYLIQPNVHLVEVQCLPLFISRGGPTPFLPGFRYGAGGTDDAIEVEWYNAATAGAPAVACPFLFMMWLSN